MQAEASGPRAVTSGEQMKIVMKVFLSLCLLVGLGATLTSNAQIESDVTIKANVPYAFVVGDTTLPAGEYTIRVAEGFSGVLMIRSDTGKTTVLFETEPVTASSPGDKNELVFDKIGDTYFLSQVFVSGDDSGSQLLKSKMQRRLEEGGSTATAHKSNAVTRIPVKIAKSLAGKRH
jgi:hypothetical protein